MPIRSQPFWWVMRPMNTTSLFSAPSCRGQNRFTDAGKQARRQTFAPGSTAVHARTNAPTCTSSNPPVAHLQALGRLERQLGSRLAGEESLHLSTCATTAGQRGAGASVILHPIQDAAHGGAGQLPEHAEFVTGPAEREVGRWEMGGSGGGRCAFRVGRRLIDGHDACRTCILHTVGIQPLASSQHPAATGSANRLA